MKFRELLEESDSNKCMAIFTASRSENSESQNDKGNAEIRSELKRLKVGYRIAKGHWPELIDGEKVKAELSAGNDEFMPGVVKAVALNTYFKAFTPGEDDVIAVAYFEALNDEGGEFAIYDGSSELGSNTSVTVYEEVDAKAVLTELVNHDEIYIDTTAVTVK